MVNVPILLLALALIAVAISVLILGKRVTALEKEFACRPSVKSLKAANRIQSFFVDHYSPIVSGGVPRPFAEDENLES